MNRSTTTSIWPFVPTGNETFDTMEIVKAKDAYIYTSLGQKILDASAGAVVGNIGWGRKEVSEAVSKSLSNLTYTLPTFITEERIALIERLSKNWLPDGFNKICFYGSGSEAIDSAIRLARQYQLSKGRNSRWKVIGRDVSYNGTSLATLAVGGHSSRRKGFEPLLLDLPHAAACYCLRCPFGKTYPSCNTACATSLEQVIQQEGADTIAAFIAEPIIGTSGGALVPPETYWPEIERICKQYDILLIADEVLTGFGRTGTKLAINHWSVDVDIIALGKGLSGGYANISGLATKEEITLSITKAKIAPMFHTYGGHPVSCAAANKVLEIMEREQLVNKVAELGPILGSKLQKLEQHPNVAQVRGNGFLYAFEVVKNKETLEQFPQEAGITFKIMDACVQRNVFIYFGGTGEARDILCISPHFIIDEKQMDEIVSASWDAIDEVCSAYAA